MKAAKYVVAALLAISIVGFVVDLFVTQAAPRCFLWLVFDGGLLFLLSAIISGEEIERLTRPKGGADGRQ